MLFLLPPVHSANVSLKQRLAVSFGKVRTSEIEANLWKINNEVGFFFLSYGSVVAVYNKVQ